MRAFRTLIILCMLLCLVPPLSLLAAGLIARWAGCELDLPPNTPLPCMILGGDYGNVLFALADFGWYAVATIPAFVALLAGWLIVEIVRAVGRPRKPRQPPVPSFSRKLRHTPTPAASRNRHPPAPAASRNRARGS
jgi:hypothetical protein